MEGTGRLKDGRMVNLECDCGSGFNCFSLIKDTQKFYWGIGGNDNALQPYTSIASNMHSVGTTIMIEELKGVTLPGTNGQKHDGCVRVDDESWSFDKGQFDFFVGRYPFYQGLDKLNLDFVHFTKSSCTPKTYKVDKAV